MTTVNIPQAPTLPSTAPTVFEMWDYSVPAPFMTSAITLDKRGQDYVSDDPVFAAERGAAAWYKSDQVLKLGDFEFGAHLFVSHAGNTKSGTKPLEEVLIACARRGEWQDYPAASGYDKYKMSVFPKAFKIVAKNAAGTVVHVFEMRDGLPINDPSLYQGYPTPTQPNRPKFDCAMFLPWWNERPRLSASLPRLFPGIIDEALRPSTAKSHFSVLSCEPEITGGYNGNSLNSLASIWQSLQWPQPKAMYWPSATEADPWANYVDCNYEGKSAQMGPWIEGWDYEPGSRSGHNWYTAPGGPRFDRCFIASQLALFMTKPDGTRPQNTLRYEEMAYGYALGYANHSNKWVSDPANLHWADDADFIESRKYYVGNYYGDGGPRSPNAIEVNGTQRDGTNASHFDINGDMPFHGWARDSLHDYATAGSAAIALQSPMLAIMSKWDTATAFMAHGTADYSGRGGNYLVRDDAWNWLHHAVGYIVGADHPLGFSRKAILDRFARHLIAINRDIAVPCMSPDRPAGDYYLEGIARFGQPLTESNGRWEFHGGGLAFYIGGVLMYMKQSGMWAELQAMGGEVKAGLDFTIRNYCQYAFGVFSQTKATMWSNPSYPRDMVFADNSNFPADWAELSARLEQGGSDFNGNPDGGVFGDRDASVHPVIQFIYVMRDFYPEIEHPWKADAIAKLDMYLKRTTDKVNSLNGDPGRQRDADHIYRVPGIAPLKPPVQIGPSPAVKLPIVLAMDTHVKPPPSVGDGTWVQLGVENDSITITEKTIVRYGAGSNWVTKEVNTSFRADNSYFGDPIPGVVKAVFKFIPAVVEVPEVPVEPPVVVVPPVETPPEPVVVPDPVPTPTEPVETPPAPVEVPPIVIPPVVTPPAEGKSVAYAMVAAAIAFLESLGYKVTK